MADMAHFAAGAALTVTTAMPAAAPGGYLKSSLSTLHLTRTSAA